MGAFGGKAPFGAGFVSSRIAWMFAIFVFLGLVWAGRLVYLQVVMADDYGEKAAASRTVNIDLPARRGTIYDRNGNVLATSVEATTIYANPKEVTDVSGTAAALAEVLGGNASDYESILTLDTTFYYVKRQADEDAADALRAKKLDGIYFIDDTKRVYPYGFAAGQIVGLVDVDGNGLTGLEKYYDDILSGTSGTQVLQLGGYSKGKGTSIPIPGGTEVDKPAQDGQDIVVSIDIDMQTDLEARLAQGVQDIGGDDGSAVLMDASTGEILAIASTPYLNPGDTANMEEGSDYVKAITQAFEPGSIFKTVSAMALLEADAITADTSIACPAYLQADEYTISDAHERPDMTMTFREIMNESSNVGISLAVEGYLGFPPLYDKILAYGLNEPTGVDYPGEAGGYLSPNVSAWPLITKYNVTFGQGISVTPLQMVRFYGALANGGQAATPHFLISKPRTGEVPEYETEQIIENTDAIPAMVDILTTVVTDGTGTAAAIDGFTVAGKTGTAEYVDEESGGYVSGSHNLSFVGMLPNASLPLVCFVGVDEVPYERATTGVFHDIMTDAINRYGIIEQ